MVEPYLTQLRAGHDYCLPDQYLAYSYMLTGVSLTKENNITSYWTSPYVRDYRKVLYVYYLI